MSRKIKWTIGVQNPYATRIGSKVYLNGAEVKHVYEANEWLGYVKYYDSTQRDEDGYSWARVEERGDVQAIFALQEGETQEQVRELAEARERERLVSMRIPGGNPYPLVEVVNVDDETCLRSRMFIRKKLATYRIESETEDMVVLIVEERT